MRAREADEQGYIERDGVRVFYEVFGTGEPTILFCPTWTLVHSRVWKMQVPYLARHHRVIVFDPRGNGRSDRPTTVEAYAEAEFAQDAIDVLDATESEQALVVGLSQGAQRALLVAAEHPERVLGLVFIGPFFPASRSPISVVARFMARPLPAATFMRKPLTTRGFAKFNGVHWRNHYRDFVLWFAAMATSEAHSTKGFEDVVEWGMQSDPETLILTWLAPIPRSAATRPSTGRTAIAARCSSARRSGSGMRVATSRSHASCVAWFPTSRSTGSPRTP